MSLFQEAIQAGIPPDGRFLNACIRCFGDDIDRAMTAWKQEFRTAALSHENRQTRSTFRSTKKKKKKNLVAAYNGLLHVCGQAGRPDIALRLVYAMNKEESVEPNEASLNSYYAGKKIRENDTADLDPKKTIRMMSQYETLLQVECTTYDKRDKRRWHEKRLRIIF